MSAAVPLPEPAAEPVCRYCGLPATALNPLVHYLVGPPQPRRVLSAAGRAGETATKGTEAVNVERPNNTGAHPLKCSARRTPPWYNPGRRLPQGTRA